MKTKLSVLLVLFICMFTSTVHAKKVLLRLNLRKGAAYEVKMNMTNLIDQQMMGQQMKIDQTMVMVFSYQVLDVLPNGNFWIEYSIQNMKMNMKIKDREMNFDTENTDESNPMNKTLNSIKSLKLKLEMNQRGQVQKVEGLDLLTKEFSANPQMAQSMSMFANDKNFGSFLNQTFNYFPEDEIETGSKWTASINLPAMMNMESVMNFEVASVEEDNVLLNVNSNVNLDSPIEQGGMKIDMKMTGNQTGTMTIGLDDCFLRSSDLTQQFDMKMKMKNPQSGEDMEIPMHMNSVAKITVDRK